MNQKLKDILVLFGAVTGFGVIINFYLWLLVAVTNPDMTVTVHFNTFGEGLTEITLYLCILPLIVFTVFYNIYSFITKYTKPKTNYNRLSTAGQVTFWTSIAIIILVGICLLLTAILNR